MKNISDFVNDIRNINGFASLTIVKTDLVKKSCPIANVTERVQYSHIAIGTSYENAVNNRNERTNGNRDFVAEPLAWGEWYIPNKVITHKGSFYLRYYTNRNTLTTRTLFVDGRPATAQEVDIINAYRKASGSSSNRQAAIGIAAADQVKPRTTNIANIVQFKYGECAI